MPFNMSDMLGVQQQYQSLQTQKLQNQYLGSELEQQKQSSELDIQKKSLEVNAAKQMQEMMAKQAKQQDSTQQDVNDVSNESMIKSLSESAKQSRERAKLFDVYKPEIARELRKDADSAEEKILSYQKQRAEDVVKQYDIVSRVANDYLINQSDPNAWDNMISELKADGSKQVGGLPIEFLERIQDPNQREKLAKGAVAKGTSIKQQNEEQAKQEAQDLKERRFKAYEEHRQTKELLDKRKQEWKEREDKVRDGSGDKKMQDKAKEDLIKSIDRSISANESLLKIKQQRLNFLQSPNYTGPDASEELKNINEEMGDINKDIDDAMSQRKQFRSAPPLANTTSTEPKVPSVQQTIKSLQGVEADWFKAAKAANPKMTDEQILIHGLNKGRIKEKAQ